MSALHGPLETVIPTYQTVLNNLKKAFNVIDNPSDTKEVTTQTSTTTSTPSTERTSRNDPLRIQPDRPRIPDSFL